MASPQFFRRPRQGARSMLGRCNVLCDVIIGKKMEALSSMSG
jgi:hypothetical protein